MMDEQTKNCFKGRGNLVKFLAVLLILLIIILVSLCVLLVVNPDGNTCNTEICIKASADLMRYVDNTQQPCDDFYNFICGNFVRNPKTLQPPTAIELLNGMIGEQLNFSDPRPFIMEKQFYQACSNLGAIEIDQDDTILELFHRLGDWPVLRGPYWNGSDYYWVDYMMKLRNFGLKFEWFIEFNIFVQNNTGTYLKIDIPKYLKPVGLDMRHHRKELMTDIAVFMGAPKSIAHYEISRTIDFEDDLGILAEKYRHRINEHESPPKLRINEVQQVWPNILWLQLINNVTGNRLIEQDYIVFDTLEYIQELNKLLMGTPKRIQVDFLLWKIMEEIWPYLSKPIRDRFEQFKIEVMREPFEFNRQRFCINETKNQFPLVAESIFIRNQLTSERIQQISEIARNVHRQFGIMLEKATWMNRELRRRGLDKIRNVLFLVGGPQEIFDEAQFYQDLGIYGFEYRSSHIITMIRERQFWLFEEKFKALSTNLLYDKREFYLKSINITDFTVINQDTIVIPVGILQDTFYNPTLPNYLNYATLGKSIARQLFNHIYKNNETHERWTMEAFDSIIQCLIQETSSYSQFRESKQLKENLADFAASDVAYESYSEWGRRHPQEILLPGLQFSPGQIFWMHSSKFLCTHKLGDNRENRDFARFKLIEPLKHSRHFVDEFNCPLGSKMNPARKCTVL